MKLELKLASLVAAMLICAEAHAGSLVVIVNPAAAPLSQEQVADLFLGRSSALVPLDQVESSSIRADFYKKVTGRDVAQVKATWARLVFTGKAATPRELADAAAVKKAVAADPKLVGYIDKASVDSSVKVALEIN